MKIAIAKPDYKVRGGFEVVVDRLAQGLRDRGHVVDLAQVDVTANAVSHLPIPVTIEQYHMFPDFFFHLNVIRSFEALDLSSYDAVLTTQPGSYAVRHPNKVALFYHHLKFMYDLFDLTLAIRSHNELLFRKATRIIRDIDGLFLTPDLPILAGSHRVKERLRQFNGLEDNVSVFYAGIDESFETYDGAVSFEDPLCVGRLEFPKRPELFIHAMKHLPDLRGRVLGTGSGTERLVAMDGMLTRSHAEGPCEVDDRALWQETYFELHSDRVAEFTGYLRSGSYRSNVDFLGRLSHEDLLREYAKSLCIVCPAFEEDFGLTCVEAMTLGKPVIACNDGGGYLELIDDGIDGFLVEPTGPAIAEAIAKLQDRDRAREMGAKGREKARQFTWLRAITQVEQALTAGLATSAR